MAPSRSRRNLSSAKAVFNNPDLLTEILLRVPATSLLRLKTVSKTWNGLISHPHFPRRHLLLHPPAKPSAFLLNNYPDQFYLLSLSHPTPTSLLNLAHFPPPATTIIQSCNGLLLLSTFSFLDSPPDLVYYVSNPTTNRLTTLPPGPPATHVLGVYLAFDPRRSPHYKVVRISDNGKLQAHLYESESREWRVAGPPLDASAGMDFQNGVYCNGAVHWVGDSGLFLRFDLDQERVISMPLPHPPDGYDRRIPSYGYLISESNGRLQLIESYHDGCWVVEMVEDYSGWVRRWWVKLKQFAPLVRKIYSNQGFYQFIILGMVGGGDGDEGEASLVVHVPGKVVSCYVRGGGYRVLCDLLGEGCGRMRRLRRYLQLGLCLAYPYFESLASV